MQYMITAAKVIMLYLIRFRIVGRLYQTVKAG